MSEYVVTDTELTAVANAIRTKGGTQANLEWYADFVSAIGAISGGGGGAKNILGGTTAPTSAEGSDGDIYLQYGLPDTYDAIDYIQSSGTQYIVIPYKPNNYTSVELKANFQSISEGAIFGSDWATNGFFLMTYQNKFRWHVSGASIANTDTISTNTDYTIEVSTNGITVDGTIYSTTPGTDVTGYALTIFYTTENKTRGSAGSFKLYYFKLYDDGALSHWLIPVKRKSDDAVGLYDIISGVFYTNSGTGTFSYGSTIDYDGVRAIYLKVNGTWQSLIGSDIDDVDTGGSTPEEDWTALKNYIESSGTQWIDTGYKCNDNTKVELVANVNTTNATYAALFGARNGTYDSATKAFGEYRENTAVTVFVGSKPAKVTVGTSGYWGYKTKYTLSKTVCGFVRSDENVFYGVEISSGSVDDVNNLYVLNFDENGSEVASSTRCSAKLYRFRIYESDVLVHEFIPWKDTNDVVCLKDTITGDLKYNAGTGTFTYGTDT